MSLLVLPAFSFDPGEVAPLAAPTVSSSAFGSATNTSNGGSYTFAGVLTGTENADRYSIFVSAGYKDTAGADADLTGNFLISGLGSEVPVTSDAGPWLLQLHAVANPSGVFSTIGYSVAISSGHIDVLMGFVLRAILPQGLHVVDTDYVTDASNVTSRAGSVSVVAGGIVIGVAAVTRGATGDHTWTGLTELAQDTNNQINMSVAADDVAADGTLNVSIAHTDVTATTSALLLLSLAPSA